MSHRTCLRFGFALTLVAGCSHQTDGPIPILTAPVSPQAACNEQVPQVVALTGDGLSPLNDHTLLGSSRIELPLVTLIRTKGLDGSAADPAAANTLEVPNDPDHPSSSDEKWTSQQSMAFGICPPGTCAGATSPAPPLLSDWPVSAYPEGKLPTGLYSINVKNRAQAKDFTLPDALVIVPLPHLERVDTDIACKDKDNAVTLSGDYFLVVNGTKPNVRLYDGAGFDKSADLANVDPEDCRALSAPAGMTLHACKTLHLEIPSGWVTLAHDTDTFRNLRVEVTGPGPVGCHSTADVEITFVPKPRLDAVEPDVACDAQGTRGLTLSGFGFLTVGGVFPSISFGSALTQTANAANGCVPIGHPGFPRESVQSCSALVTALAQNALPPADPGADPSDYAVTVANPAPAGCATSAPADLTIPAPPLIAEVVPDLACNAQGDSTFTIKGSAFVRLADATPSVTFADSAGKSVTVASTVEGADCVAHPGPVEAMQSCTRLKATVPQASLAVGAIQVEVTNPGTAGCVSPSAPALLVAPPKVTAVQPQQVCTAQDNVLLKVSGTDFLVVDSVAPDVHLVPAGAGAALVLSPVTAVDSSCTPVTGIKQTVKRCTELMASTKEPVPVASTYDVVVFNPPPAGCSSLGLGAPVSIAGTPPPTLTDVTVPNGVSPSTMCSGGGTLRLTGSHFEAGALVNVGPLQNQVAAVTSDTSATVDVAGGLSPSSTPYDVTLVNPDGCSATKAAALKVTQGLMVFFTDPPTVWNGINTQITVYGANVSGAIQKASIVEAGTSGTPTALATSPSGNRATALVPKGTAPGTYDVIVQDGSCTAVLPAGLRVVSTATLTLAAITPTYGSSQVSTGVTVTSNGAFVPMPRVYLSSGTGTATALSALVRVDASTMTAVVPKGLAPGTYDLIVVNPDGGVGALPRAFTVIASLTPVVTALNPTVVPSTGASVNIQGINFANNVAMSFVCFNDDGTSAGTVTGFTQSAPTACGSQQCVAVSGLTPLGAYCLARATHPTDGATFDFSALVVQTPALKMGSFTAANGLTTGRRGLGMATAQVTPSARFIYAIGGDTGNSTTGALKTVEAAPVDVYGNLGKWFPLPNTMQSARTFLGVVAVDRFLYALGGMNGTGALTSVERAYVLNPADAPTFTDLDFEMSSQGQGVPGGTYSYRVSAVMPAGNPYNPGGENLPSDPLVLLAPNLASGVSITLTWSPVPGAASYRVYRSATPNLPSGSEVLIADTVPTASFKDTYAAPILVGGSTVKPLPQGATGVWSSTGLPALKVARAGAAVTSIADLMTPSNHTLYVLGGNSGTEAAPNVLKSTELLVVDTTVASQSVSAGSPSPDLSTPRWQSAGMSAVINGGNYVWAVEGLPGPLDTIDGSAIKAGGVPAGFSALSNTPDASGRAGLIALAATNQLVVYGGLNAAPDASGRHGLIMSPPGVQNFNAEPSSLRSPRYLMGYAVQSSYLFVCGGVTVANQLPVATCETTRF